MELQREFLPTNRFRLLSPYVADSLASIPSGAQLSVLL